jgi:DNA-directed RNA polymerase subunit M/transcription elongation factor TFIIS
MTIWICEKCENMIMSDRIEGDTDIVKLICPDCLGKGPANDGMKDEKEGREMRNKKGK